LWAGPEIRGAVGTAWERVGLADAADRRFRGYSLGMKQRLGLAAALLVPRRLVVLDEPTNGLDPAGTRDVRRIVAELHAGGATALGSSHLLAEVEATCTHVAVLQAGGPGAPGGPGALLEAGTGGLVVAPPPGDTAPGAVRGVAPAAVPGGAGVGVAPGGPPAPRGAAPPARAGVAVHEARRRRARLEELFARLTEESP